MDHETICRWLGIPATQWPPDHHTLLGLTQGEVDCAIIEQRVHERLNLVRRYQLSHPEQATAAMNQLAHAFACLTEAGRRKKQAAVATLPHPALTTEESTVISRVEALEDTVVGKRPTEVNWREHTPPPARSADSLIPVVESTSMAPAALAPTLPAGDPATVSAPAVQPSVTRPSGDSVAVPPRISRAAQRGLTSRRAILERILQTRELLRLWEQAGRYLGNEKRRVTRPAECNELNRCLNQIDELLQDFPRFLGRPAQFGYRVAVLANDESPVARFREQDAEQRKLLAKDWRASLALLKTHLNYLADTVARQRQMSCLQRWLWPVYAFAADHRLEVALGLLGSVALTVLLVAWWW